MARPYGSGTITKEGYVYHANSISKFEHVLIAEKALGKKLPHGAGVHHVNGIKSDNRNCNLVIYPNQKYHLLLHVRARAFDATGDASKRKCSICKQYDDVPNLYVYKHQYWHRSCRAKYDKERKMK